MASFRLSSLGGGPLAARCRLMCEVRNRSCSVITVAEAALNAVTALVFLRPAGGGGSGMGGVAMIVGG